MNQATLVLEWTWKTQSMRAMTLAVLRLALERGPNGEFSSMDLPLRGSDAQGGTGIAGSVFRQLKEAGIIARKGTWIDGTWYPKTITNAGGNPVGLYALANPSLAQALLAAHAPVEMFTQPSLDL